MRPSIPILYEDNHIIVVVKPVNMPSQADPSGDLDLLTAVKEDIKERYQKPGSVYVGLVHRLDRPVGGAMVFAKTSKAASRLSESVRSRSMDKEYLAVVHGRPAADSDRLTHYLWKDSSKNKVFAVRKNHKLAKEAVLDYKLLGSKDGFSLVQIKLHTGRTHQIRVQMAEIGCPLYGDQKYGAHLNRPGQQTALWSILLAFDHPTKDERLSLNSLPPRDHPWNLWEQELYSQAVSEQKVDL
jgi:23S rRNA pseudouridine1911/1915/1917 synthase